jgi:hypothetical protein
MMKTITQYLLAGALAVSMPLLAEEAHHPAGQAPSDGQAQTTPEPQSANGVEKMQSNLTKMKTQLEQLAQAKTPEERKSIVSEHMKSLQENMGMARAMHPDAGGCPMMQGGMGMGMMGQGMKGGMGMMNQGSEGSSDMMAKRMEMMEKRMDMMQMMMQGGMKGMPAGSPAKSAK